jgi:hypothetical protein
MTKRRNGRHGICSWKSTTSQLIIYFLYRKTAHLNFSSDEGDQHLDKSRETLESFLNTLENPNKNHLLNPPNHIQHKKHINQCRERERRITRRNTEESAKRSKKAESRTQKAQSRPYRRLQKGKMVPLCTPHPHSDTPKKMERLQL